MISGFKLSDFDKMFVWELEAWKDAIKVREIEARQNAISDHRASQSSNRNCTKYFDKLEFERQILLIGMDGIYKQREIRSSNFWRHNARNATNNNQTNP